MTRDSFQFEDILADQRREQAPVDTLEAPIPRHSVQLFLWATFLLFVFFGFRVFSLSVLKGDLFAYTAERSRDRIFPIAATRGTIFDRSGTVLADNEPSFQLIFDPLEARALSAKDREEKLVAIAEVLGTSSEEIWQKIIPFEKQAEPRVVISSLDREKAIALEAANLADFLRVEPTLKRRYPEGADIFAAVLGYVGAASEEDLKDGKYSPRDLVGKTGIERKYESDLHGLSGRRRILVDARGRPQGDAVVEDPKSGENIRLTVDAGLTKVAASALADEMHRVNSPAGAVVAIDPRDGAVRALISLPSYDAEALSAGLSFAEYEKIVKNPHTPLLNRAIGGVYPSGSTVKPFVAAAALTENIISPYRKIDDTRGLIQVQSIYDPAVSWTFRDWRVQGFVNMFEAIARSANVYFYTVGGGYGDVKGLGVDRLVHYLSAFGFGKQLGIDLDNEAPGRIPTPEWKEKAMGEQWFIGDTYNLSIGQGNFGVTPLQLATATAAVANGGTLYQPHVLDSVLHPDGSILRSNEATILTSSVVPSQHLAIVRQGMRDAVTQSYGTNRILADLPVAAAAKTGTAQYGGVGKTHALVTAFTPYDHPELTLAIVLEGGGEGTNATHVAKKIFAWYAGHRQ